MSRENPQAKIRFPEELKAAIDAAASANKRSINAEVIDRLQATFDIDEAMQVGHRGADYSHAAGALRQLEQDLSDMQEEVEAMTQSGYAEEMHSLLKSIQFRQEEDRLLLSAIALMGVPKDQDESLAVFAKQVLADVPDAKEVPFPQGIHALKEIIRVLKVRAFSDALGV